MKPPVFDYHDPETVEEALDLLAEHGDEGKVLAGGQSLVPLLNFRLAHPEHLIDLNRIGALAGIRRQDGSLRIGAMTRQATMEHSVLVAENWPLLTEALTYVAHAQIRNRGTIGGSVAHADPAAELPVAFAALDARVNVRSARAERTIEICRPLRHPPDHHPRAGRAAGRHRGRLGPRRTADTPSWSSPAATAISLWAAPRCR